MYLFQLFNDSLSVLWPCGVRCLNGLEWLFHKKKKKKKKKNPTLGFTTVVVTKPATVILAEGTIVPIRFFVGCVSF